MNHFFSLSTTIHDITFSNMKTKELDLMKNIFIYLTLDTID